jgi:hypothetical protein
MRVLVVQRAQLVGLRWADQGRAHVVPARIECHRGAAPAATAVGITSRWWPLGRIVSSFPSVIMAGLLCDVVLSSLWLCRAGPHIACSPDSFVPFRRPDAPGV